MLVMQAAVAKPLAAILADQPAALKCRPAILVAKAQAAVLKSLLATLAELQHAIAAVDSRSAMVACSASCSSTSRAAMKSLATLAQPLVARPVVDRLLLLPRLPLLQLQLLIPMPT
jgi:hypothetical protein